MRRFPRKRGDWKSFTWVLFLNFMDCGTLADSSRPSSARISYLEEENRSLRMRLEGVSSTSSTNTSRDFGSASSQSSATANLVPKRSSKTSSAVPSKQDVRNQDTASSNSDLGQRSGSGEYTYHGLTSASALDEASWSHIPSRDTSHDPQISTDWIQKQLEAEAWKQRESFRKCDGRQDIRLTNKQVNSKLSTSILTPWTLMAWIPNSACICCPSIGTVNTILS